MLDFQFPEEYYALHGEMRGRDGGREWLRNLSPDPVVRAEFLQRLRVDATRFVLHPNLSDEEQGENLQVIKACEMLLPALAQELSELGKPLNPPNAVLHYGREPWEKRLTLDRLLKLEQKYPSLIKEYAEGCLPFHRIGEPLWLEHIETGEYSCLKRALGFLLDDSEQKLAEAHSNAVRIAQKGQDSPQGKGKRNRGPEYGKDAEEIRIAQAAADQQNQPVSGGGEETLSNTAPAGESIAESGEVETAAGRGGRKRDKRIKDRNDLIVTLKNSHSGTLGVNRNRNIALALHEQGYLPPRDWGVSSFPAALRVPKSRERFHQMVSKAK